MVQAERDLCFTTTLLPSSPAPQCQNIPVGTPREVYPPSFLTCSKAPPPKKKTSLPSPPHNCSSTAANHLDFVAGKQFVILLKTDCDTMVGVCPVFVAVRLCISDLSSLPTTDCFILLCIFLMGNNYALECSHITSEQTAPLAFWEMQAKVEQVLSLRPHRSLHANPRNDVPSNLSQTIDIQAQVTAFAATGLLFECATSLLLQTAFFSRERKREPDIWSLRSLIQAIETVFCFFFFFCSPESCSGFSVSRGKFGHKQVSNREIVWGCHRTEEWTNWGKEQKVVFLFLFFFFFFCWMNNSTLFLQNISEVLRTFSSCWTGFFCGCVTHFVEISFTFAHRCENYFSVTSLAKLTKLIFSNTLEKVSVLWVGLIVFLQNVRSQRKCNTWSWNVLINRPPFFCSEGRYCAYLI